jgi:hypothetical protein
MLSNFELQMDMSNWNLVLFHLPLATNDLDDVAKVFWSGVVFMDSFDNGRRLHFL